MVCSTNDVNGSSWYQWPVDGRGEDVCNQARFEDAVGIFPEFIDGGPAPFSNPEAEWLWWPKANAFPKLDLGRGATELLARCAWMNYVR